MADNIELESGSGGSILATDDISSEHYQKILVGWGVDGTWTRVTAAAGLPVAPETGATWAITNDDTVDAANSTTTPLGISATFTGTGVDCLGYSAVTVTVKADQDSAVDGMLFEFSPDDTNWDDSNTFTFALTDGSRRFQFPITARYFRVKYTNGSTGQGAFRVQTILHRQNTLTSIHRLVDDISPDRSATLVKAVIAAQSAGSGDYMVVQATAAGNFKVSVEEVNGAEMPVKGTIAHDAPDTGVPPVKIGGKAATSEPGAVANSDIVNAYFDATGHQHVKVDGTATVSGTVTANAGTNLNTSALALEAGGNLATIAGDTTSLDGKVTACNTGAVVISSGTVTTVSTVTSVTAIANALPAGDNNIGNVDIVSLPAGNLGAQAKAASLSTTIATDDTHFGTVGTASDIDGVVHGQLRYMADQLVTIDSDTDAIKTAVEILDNTVAVLGTATYTETTTSGTVVGAVRNDDLATLAGTDNEIGPLQLNSAGALYTEPAQQVDYVFNGAVKTEIKRATGIAASGTTVMVAAVGSRKIRVLALQLTATKATVTNVYIANDDNDIIGSAADPIPLAVDADGDNIAGFVMNWNPGGWFETDTVNQALNLILSAAFNVVYALTYIEVV